MHKHTFLEDGSVLCDSGDADICDEFMRYLNGSLKKPPNPKRMEKYAAIRIYPTGKTTFYESGPQEYTLDHSFHACGIGHEFARAAMALGLSAAEAVVFASEMDIYTNNIVDTWNWKTKEYIKG